MFDFDGGSRRRTFDRTNNNNVGEQNSTGYSEKTVFPTDFGSAQPNNYQTDYAQPTQPQTGLYDVGYGPAQPQNGGYNADPLSVAQTGYAQPAQPQGYGTAQQTAAPVATAQVSGLPMVFASRTHKDVYVYEYHDRLEWYLRTATCMHLFNIDRKRK
ncbi:MAG: hypothetical protein K2F90_00360 [Clostridiales bacterium]|nr:hypothetical protein [Clostridiales bacterium]